MKRVNNKVVFNSVASAIVLLGTPTCDLVSWGAEPKVAPKANKTIGKKIGVAGGAGDAASGKAHAAGDPVRSTASALPRSTGHPPVRKTASKTSATDAGAPSTKLSPAAELEKTHSLFSSELRKYVVDGLVNYRDWKRQPKPLNDYLNALSKISAERYQKLTKQQKMALWINAYNAFTIKLVLDNYPIKGTKSYYPPDSIRQIDGFWENNFLDICGEKVSLESMEHDRLRRDCLDPRTHFAVVCAAKGCARIRDKAYSASGLEDELSAAARSFLGEPQNVKLDSSSKTLHVSSLFKWFPLDFSNTVGLGKRFPPPTDDEIVATYICETAPEPVRKEIAAQGVKNLTVTYDSYDWALNEAPAAGR